MSSNSLANFIGGKLPDFDLEVFPSFLDLGHMFLVKVNKRCYTLSTGIRNILGAN